MRRCLPLFLLLVIAVPSIAAEAETSRPDPGYFIHAGLSDTEEFGVGFELGFGYAWRDGNWSYRLDAISFTGVDNKSDRYREERQTLLFYTQTVCRDTQTNELVDLDKCSEGKSLYTPSLEALYDTGYGELGVGFRAGPGSAAYVAWQFSAGIDDSVWKLRAGADYVGISYAWHFGGGN